ncbi:MAG TPA: hypothetical protein VGS41_09430, partial [Chthonomonadales bacterium]|nr:hypothetical protein [Chthonomonadales bacterium]
MLRAERSAEPAEAESGSAQAGSSAQASSPSAAANQRQYAWAAAAISLLAIVVRAFVLWKTHSTAEDFLISLRYAQNIAHGRGFVYNPGQRVLGTTTPLYTL